MSEGYSVYRQLTPLRTLALLVQVAHKNRGLPAAGLDLSFESADVVSLCVTDNGKTSTLNKLVRDEYGNNPYNQKVRPEKLIPLAKSLPLLALSTSTRGVTAAERIANEYMLVGQEMDSKEFERAAGLFRYVNIPTQVSRTTLNDKPVALFYLMLTDKGALKNVQEGLGNYPLLGAYKTGKGDTLFMPLERTVDRDCLGALAELVRTAHMVWGKEPPRPNSKLLLALDVTRDLQKNLVQVWYLASLEFVAPDWTQIQVQVHALQYSQKEVDALRQRIRDSAPPWGYPLELHAMERLAPDWATYDVTRVRRRINELEALVKYLESIQVERPRLYRFTQKQLPALANLIANFPPHVLAEEKLKYGFESNERNPEGLHYLYFEPSIDPLARPDPTPMWTHLDNEPMSFWLDPYWAKAYYDPLSEEQRKNPDCLIFVPEWSAMFPAFHDWDAESIGKSVANFMRESALQWAKASTARGSNEFRRAALDKFQPPAKPFYIFDETVDHTVHISVLDSKRFVPIKMRLDWLNQNLYLHSELGTETLIRMLADPIQRWKHVKSFEERAMTAEDNFRRLAEQTERRIATTMENMVNETVSGLENIRRKTIEAILRIRELNRRLVEVEKKYADLNGTPEDIEKGFQDTRAFLNQLEDALRTLEVQADTKVGQAVSEREHVSRQVNDKIAALQADIRKMRRRLYDLFS